MSCDMVRIAPYPAVLGSSVWLHRRAFSFGNRTSLTHKRMLVNSLSLRYRNRMNKQLLSRVMRQLARHRHQQARQDPALHEHLQQIVSKAGRASWDKLTPAERDARIARMVAARQKKAGRKQ